MRWIVLLLGTGCEEAGSIRVGAGDDSDGAPVAESDTPVEESPPDEDTPPTTDDTDPPQPPADPPVATAPCGNDLDVHNGTAQPRLARVPAGAPLQGDLDGEGPYQVIERNGRVDNPYRGFDALGVTSYVPSDDGQTAAQGTFPLVLLMPGYGASYNRYTHLSRPLASHGFVVVGLDFASAGLIPTSRHDENAGEALAVLDWALTAGPFADRIDPTKIAAIGHSMGGKIAFYAASLDARIDLVVAWDPQNTGGPPCGVDGLAPGDCNDFPVAPNCQARDAGRLHLMHAESLVFGTEDNLLAPDPHLRADQFYRGAPSPTAFVSMPEASHAAWIFDGSESSVTRRAHTALLLTRFRGVTGLEDWLPGGTALAGAEGVRQVRVK